MGRPKADVAADQWPAVRAAIRAHQDVQDARDALREAEEDYAAAVIAALDTHVAQTALAREIGVSSQTLRDLVKRSR